MDEATITISTFLTNMGTILASVLTNIPTILSTLLAQPVVMFCFIFAFVGVLFRWAKKVIHL